MANRVSVLLPMLMLSICASASAEMLDAVMLKYMVSESGVEPYASRIIVTANMLRMDDDDPQGDYLLFDRDKQLISSVTHSDGTVLEIPLRELPEKSPLLLRRDSSLEPDDKAPRIGNGQPHKLRLFVNEKLCYDAVVVPGLLPDVLDALRDFYRVLAGEQGKVLARLPAEMLDDCDLAIHTFYPEWPLQSGLAIQAFDVVGQRGQLLVDINQSFKVKKQLLTLPGGYKRYRTP